MVDVKVVYVVYVVYSQWPPEGVNYDLLHRTQRMRITD